MRLKFKKILFRKVHKTNSLTLVELMIAALIFVIGAVSILSSWTYTLFLMDLSKSTQLANAHSRVIMEKIWSTSFTSLTTDFPDGVIDGNPGNNYSNMVGGYSLNNEHITVYYDNVSVDPLEIKVECTWQDRQGRNYSINNLSTFRTR